MDPAPKTLTLTVPNGTLNRHHHHQQQQQQAVYRECLRNHAASLGGHSLDGCGEFMASPSSDPSDPTSLTCAACGCHRNFHRRLPFLALPSPPLPQPLLLQHPQQQQQQDDDNNEDDEDEEGSEDDDRRREDADGETGDNNNTVNYINNSNVPHMLIALSTVAAAGTTAQQQQEQQEQQRSRKRFRTRFSPEQKERMQELSERLGWRMQKRDEGLVEDRCREIGVGKGVFKVWMHNNKHNFVTRSPSSSANLASSLLPPAAASSLAIPTVSAMSTLGGDGRIVNGVGDVRVNGPGSAAS